MSLPLVSIKRASLFNEMSEKPTPSFKKRQNIISIVPQNAESPSNLRKPHRPSANSIALGFQHQNDLLNPSKLAQSHFISGNSKSKRKKTKNLPITLSDHPLSKYMTVEGIRENIRNENPIIMRGSPLLKRAAAKLISLVQVFCNEKRTQAILKNCQETRHKKMDFADHFEIIKLLGTVDLHIIRKQFTQLVTFPKIFLEDFLVVLLNVFFIDDQEELFFLAIGLFELFLNIFQCVPSLMSKVTKKFIKKKGVDEGNFWDSLSVAIAEYGYPINEFLITESPFLWITYDDFVKYYVYPSHIADFKKLSSPATSNIVKDEDVKVKNRRIQQCFKSKSENLGTNVKKIQYIDKIWMLVVLNEKTDQLKFYNSVSLKLEHYLGLDKSKHVKKHQEITDFCFDPKSFLICALLHEGCFSIWMVDQSFREKQETGWNIGYYVTEDKRTPIVGNFEYLFYSGETHLSVFVSSQFDYFITASVANIIYCWPIDKILKKRAKELNQWKNEEDITNALIKSHKQHANHLKISGLTLRNVLPLVPKKIDVGVNGRVTGFDEIPSLGCFLFSSYEKRIVIWDYKRNELFGSIPLPSTSAHQIIFVPERNYIIPCCFDKVLQIYELGTADEITLAGNLVGHASQIVSVLVFGKLDLIITGDESNNVRLWNIYSLRSTQNIQLEKKASISGFAKTGEMHFVSVSKHLTFFKIEKSLKQEEESENPIVLKDQQTEGIKEKTNQTKLIPFVFFDLRENEKRFFIGTSARIVASSFSRECILSAMGPIDWGLSKSKSAISAFCHLNLPVNQLAVADVSGGLFLVSDKYHELGTRPERYFPFYTSQSKEKKEKKRENLAKKQNKFDETQAEKMFWTQLEKGGLTTLAWNEMEEPLSQPSPMEENPIKTEDYVKQILYWEQSQLLVVCGKRRLSILSMEKFTKFIKVRSFLIQDEPGKPASLKEAKIQKETEIEHAELLESSGLIALHLSNDSVLFLDFYTLEVRKMLVHFDTEAVAFFDSKIKEKYFTNYDEQESTALLQSVPSIMSTKKKGRSYVKKRTGFSSESLNTKEIDFKLIAREENLKQALKPIRFMMLFPKSEILVLLDESHNLLLTSLKRRHKPLKIDHFLDCQVINWPKNSSISSWSTFKTEDYQNEMMILLGDSNGFITILNLREEIQGMLAREQSIGGVGLEKEEQKQNKRDPFLKCQVLYYLSELNEKISEALSPLKLTRESLESGFVTSQLRKEDYERFKGFSVATSIIHGQSVGSNQVILGISAEFIVKIWFKNKREREEEPKGKKKFRNLIEIDLTLSKIISWNEHSFHEEWLQTHSEYLQAVFEEVERVMALTVPFRSLRGSQSHFLEEDKDQLKKKKSIQVPKEGNNAQMERNKGFQSESRHEEAKGNMEHLIVEEGLQDELLLGQEMPQGSPFTATFHANEKETSGLGFKKTKKYSKSRDNLMKVASSSDKPIQLRRFIKKVDGWAAEILTNTTETSPTPFKEQSDDKNQRVRLPVLGPRASEKGLSLFSGQKQVPKGERTQSTQIEEREPENLRLSTEPSRKIAKKEKRKPIFKEKKSVLRKKHSVENYLMYFYKRDKSLETKEPESMMGMGSDNGVWVTKLKRNVMKQMNELNFKAKFKDLEIGIQNPK